jgi:hypothetical protein
MKERNDHGVFYRYDLLLYRLPKRSRRGNAETLTNQIEKKMESAFEAYDQ